MAKILRDTELLDIVMRIVKYDALCEAHIYRDFLQDLGDLITKFCGGEAGRVDRGGEGHGPAMSFRVNDSVPPDGGVYSKYDTDITWKDGEEIG